MTVGRERLPYAQNTAALTAYAGVGAEIVPTLDGRVVVMDGVTLGGHELGRADLSNLAPGALAAAFAALSSEDRTAIAQVLAAVLQPVYAP